MNWAVQHPAVCFLCQRSLRQIKGDILRERATHALTKRLNAQRMSAYRTRSSVYRDQRILTHAKNRRVHAPKASRGAWNNIHSYWVIAESILCWLNFHCGAVLECGVLFVSAHVLWCTRERKDSRDRTSTDRTEHASWEVRRFGAEKSSTHAYMYGMYVLFTTCM